VETGLRNADDLDGRGDAGAERIDDVRVTRLRGGGRRVAQCECGAQLAGETEQRLFDAIQRHLAHHHPQLLGALGLELVTQMAEDVGG
jgi:hypothetical protein